MQIELTEQEIDTTIDALRYQYDGCADAEDGQDEENNRIADKLRDALKGHSTSQADAKGASVDRIPFPDFMMPLLECQPNLKKGEEELIHCRDSEDWWQWDFDTGMPFSICLTNCHTDEGQRWHVLDDDRYHVGGEVTSLREVLRVYGAGVRKVLDETPDRRIPELWKALLVEHDLLKVKAVTTETYHFS